MKKITALLFTFYLIGSIFVFSFGIPLTPAETTEYVLEGVQTFDSVDPIDKNIRLKKDAAITVTDPDGTLDLGENGSLTVEGVFKADMDTIDLRDGELAVSYGGECILHAEHLLFDRNSRLTVSEGGYFEITAGDGTKDFLLSVTEKNIPCRIQTNSETGKQTFILGKRPCPHQNTDTVLATTVLCMDCGAPVAIESMGYASSFFEGNSSLLFALAGILLGAAGGILGTLAFQRKKKPTNHL